MAKIYFAFAGHIKPAKAVEQLCSLCTIGQWQQICQKYLTVSTEKCTLPRFLSSASAALV